jgi:hypothetical protein
VIFQFDPKADKQAGIDLFFAHTVPDGTSWNIVKDPNGPLHLPIKRCDETECDAFVGGGTPDEATLKLCADLVARMLSGSHIFLSYTRNGHFYQTAINVALFKEAYQRLLVQASAPVETPAKPQ